MTIRKLTDNILRGLLAIFGLGTFTACYGPAPYSPEVWIEGTVVSESGAPIRNIEITSDAYDGKTSSASDGIFYYGIIGCAPDDVPETVTLTFTDKDGPENGGDFQEQSVTVDIQKQKQASDKIVVKMKPIQPQE